MATGRTGDLYRSFQQTFLLRIAVIIMVATIMCHGMRGGCNCGRQTIVGSSGYLESPRYPRNYPNNCNCVYTITVPSSHRVRLTFSRVEIAQTCNDDYITVVDSDSSRLAFLCSTKADLLTLTSSGRTIQVRFTSDGKRSMPGFQASYLAVLPTTPVATTTPIATTTVTTVSTPRPTTTAPSSTMTSSTATMTTTTMATTTTTPPSTTTVTTSTKSMPSTSVRSSSMTGTLVDPTTVTAGVDAGAGCESCHASTTGGGIVGDKNRRIGSPSLVWVYSAIAGVLLVLLLAVMIAACYVRHRRSKKSLPPSGSNDIDLTTLDGRHHTTITNRTYQSSDDIIPSTVAQRVPDDNGVTKYRSDGDPARDLIYNIPNERIENPVYQRADSGGKSGTVVSAKYAKVKKIGEDKGVYQSIADGESGVSDHQYAATVQSPTEYQYADGTTTAYAYADSQLGSPATPGYEYADTKLGSPETPGYEHANKLEEKLRFRYNGNTPITGNNEQHSPPNPYTSLDTSTQEFHGIPSTSRQLSDPGYAKYDAGSGSNPYQSLSHEDLTDQNAGNPAYSDLQSSTRYGSEPIVYAGSGSNAGATRHQYQPLMPAAGSNNPEEKQDNESYAGPESREIGTEDNRIGNHGYQQLSNSGGIGDDREYSSVSRNLYVDGYMVPDVGSKTTPGYAEYDLVSTEADADFESNTRKNSDVYDVVSTGPTSGRGTSEGSDEAKYYQAVGNPRRGPSSSNSDVYDVVTDRAMYRPTGNSGNLTRIRETNETYEEFNTELAKPVIADSGYTEYNAQGHGPYQDLKARDKIAHALRKY